MGADTKIEWCDATWNPWVGCEKEHVGCLNCYAEAMMDDRLHFAQWGRHGTRRLTEDGAWETVQGLRRAAVRTGTCPTVFVASLSDFFEHWSGQITGAGGAPLWLLDQRAAENGRPVVVDAQERPGGAVGPCTMADVRRAALLVMKRSPELRFLLLTKRPRNVERMLRSVGWSRLPWNVALGVSVSDERTACDYGGRLRTLKESGVAPLVFLSYEPAVGPVRWRAHRLGEWCDWLIVGGESGPDARAFSVEYARAAVAECAAAGVPLFVKQLGENPVGWDSGDGKRGDPEYWPQDIRVRQRLIGADGTIWRPTQGQQQEGDGGGVDAGAAAA